MKHTLVLTIPTPTKITPKYTYTLSRNDICLACDYQSIVHSSSGRRRGHANVSLTCVPYWRVHQRCAFLLAAEKEREGDGDVEAPIKSISICCDRKVRMICLQMAVTKTRSERRASTQIHHHYHNHHRSTLSLSLSLGTNARMLMRHDGRSDGDGNAPTNGICIVIIARCARLRQLCVIALARAGK